MGRTHVITSTEKAKAVTSKILSNCSVLGTACKHERSGQVSVVLFCNELGDLFVFDIKADRDIMYDGGVARILQSNDILKVIHDCARSATDLELHNNVFLRQVFDTQVAYSVILESEDLPVRRVTLQSLCQRTEVPRPPCKLSHKLQTLLQQDENVWSRRPLTNELVSAMAVDVIPLVPHLYNKLLKAIHPVYMSWFRKMNQEHLQSCKTPETVRRTRLARVTQERLDTSKDKPLDKLTLRQRILLADSIPLTRELQPSLLHRSQHLVQSGTKSRHQTRKSSEYSGKHSKTPNSESPVDIACREVTEAFISGSSNMNPCILKSYDDAMDPIVKSVKEDSSGD